jgi:hypothetical protein
MNHDECMHVTIDWHVLRLQMYEQPPIWRVAENILNRQSWTANKGGPPAGVGQGAHNALQKLASLQNGIIVHELVLVRWYNLSNGKWT